MIQKLEDELSIKIFDRTTHPIRTTDAGDEIISSAKTVLESITELKNKAHSLNNVLAGKINLGIIPTVSGFLIPNEIFDFLNQNQKIEMNIHEMNTENIIKSLKSGEIDAGIISTPYHETEDFNVGPYDTLGDIIISLERVEEQASEYNHSFEREFYYVLTHGILHILGYDHIEEEDKKLMREREEAILSSFGYTRDK